MQFSELKTEVFRRLDESALAPVYWEVLDVELSLNDGLAEMADATEYYETTYALALAVATTYYDLRLFTHEPLRVTSVYNRTTSRWLIPSSVRDLDKIDPRWGLVPGEPDRYFVRGLFTLGVFPRPTTIETVDVYHTAMPPVLALAADTPIFPAEFHVGLIEYALADLLSQDGEAKEALAHWEKYLEYESGLSTWVKNRAKNGVGGFRE